jgi:hypothetical protein
VNVNSQIVSQIGCVTTRKTRTNNDLAMGSTNSGRSLVNCSSLRFYCLDTAGSNKSTTGVNTNKEGRRCPFVRSKEATNTVAVGRSIEVRALSQGLVGRAKPFTQVKTKIESHDLDMDCFSFAANRNRDRSYKAKIMEPLILDQYAVIDKWWTENREQILFVRIQVDDQECVLRYDVQTKIFSIQEKMNVGTQLHGKIENVAEVEASSPDKPSSSQARNP